jgi:hypothetical protein
MGGSVLLRGLQAHDDELEAVLADDTTKAILWPGAKQSKICQKQAAKHQIHNSCMVHSMRCIHTP